MNVNQTGLHLGPLLVGEHGRIGKDVAPFPGQDKVFPGNGLFDRIQLEGMGGNLHAVGDGGGHFVIAVNHRRGNAGADVRTGGNVHAAGPGAQLGLVKGRHGHGAAFQLRIDPGDLRLADRMADRHGRRAGDGVGGSLSGDRAGQGLYRQAGDESLFHIHGQPGGDVDLAVFIRGHVALDVHGRLVAVNTDSHRSGNDIPLGMFRGDGSGGGPGAEIARVYGADGHVASRVNRPLYGDGGGMQRHRNAYRGGYLELLVLLVSLRRLDVVAVCCVVGLIRRVAGGLVGILRAVHLRVLGPEDVGGDVQMLIGFVSVLVLHPLIVQPVGNPRGGFVLLFVLLCFLLIVFLVVFAGSKFVDRLSGGLRLVGKFVQRPLHVCAHGTGEGVGLILAGAFSPQGNCAFGLDFAACMGFYFRQGHIYGHGAADNGGAPGGKRGGPGLCFPAFQRLHHHAAGGQFLPLAALFPGVPVDIPGGFQILLRITGRGHLRSIRDGGSHIVVHNEDGYGGVNAYILLVQFSGTFLRVFFRCGSLQGIGSGGGIVLLFMLRLGYHCKGSSFDACVA